MSGGYVRGQQVWHHISISSDARDCDLEQVTSPAVKVQTSLARRSWDALILSEAWGYSAERHVFKYWINHSLDYFFFLSQMDALS